MSGASSVSSPDSAPTAGATWVACAVHRVLLGPDGRLVQRERVKQASRAPRRAAPVPEPDGELPEVRAGTTGGCGGRSAGRLVVRMAVAAPGGDEHRAPAVADDGPRARGDLVLRRAHATVGEPELVHPIRGDAERRLPPAAASTDRRAARASGVCVGESGWLPSPLVAETMSTRIPAAGPRWRSGLPHRGSRRRGARRRRRAARSPSRRRGSAAVQHRVAAPHARGRAGADVREGPMLRVAHHQAPLALARVGRGRSARGPRHRARRGAGGGRG